MRTEDLKAEIARFDPDRPLAESSTPPSTWYTEPAVYRLERRSVFASSWIVAARTEQLAGPGDYVTGEIAGERYLLTRDGGGELRAFVNVCRHRATAVASGCGRAEKLVCPYHGWTYGLDGSLLAAPELGGVKGFVKAESGLLPLKAAQWGPLVFVTRAERPRDLAADLAPLAERLAPTGYESIRFVKRRSWELACNWKVFVDNYLDGGYHVPFLHRGLASQLDLGSYRTEIFGRLSIQSTSGTGKPRDRSAAAEGGSPGRRDAPGGGSRGPGRPRGDATAREMEGGAAGGEDGGPAVSSGAGDFAERIGRGAVYAWIYPTLMINRYGPIMDTNWVVPLGPDRTRVHMDYYFEETEGEGAGEFIRRSLGASSVVQEEDVAICESVQQGLASTSFDSGRYSVTRQAGEHHFHRLLAADLRGAVAAAPAQP